MALKLSGIYQLQCHKYSLRFTFNASATDNYDASYDGMIFYEVKRSPYKVEIKLKYVVYQNKNVVVM